MFLSRPLKVILTTPQLDAIEQTKVNMTVYIANYPISTDDDAAYDRQRDELKATLETYGTTHVSGMTVGNEYILE